MSVIIKRYVIQTLILSKERFKTLTDAKKWVKDHHFKVPGQKLNVLKPEIDETNTSYRFRQRPPSDFVQGSFRTISVTNGVKAVIGQLKTGKK
jgi:hypothetical protein